MKKHNFTKLMAFMLTAMMLIGVLAAVIPASAAVETPIYIVPNEDNWVNGVKIRFETTGTDSYAKIEDGKLVLKMKQGDLLWFPELQIKDETTTLKYEMIINKDDVIPYVATGIQPATDTEHYFYCQGFGNWGKWVCARTGWVNTASTIIKVDSKGDYWYKNDWNMDEHGITPLPGSAISKKDDTLTTTTTFTMGDVALRPVTSFKEGEVEDAYIHTYDSKEDVNINGSFGIVARLDNMEISLDEVVATNINGNNGSYSENFETIESYSGPIINMRQAGTLVEFDSGIGFITFNFMLHETVTADTEFVVKKNGVEVDRKAVSTFTAVEGVYTYDTYFMTVEYTDMLSVCLEKDGQVLDNSSYEIDYGPQYKDYIDNPPPVTSATLINLVYSESFDKAIVLQPGLNTVNGMTWNYVKNSADGSAVIKDGRLYFTGSNNDMLILEDVNVDKIAYTLQYDVTYLDTPADDIWTEWNCWFGTLNHFGTADASGNRHAYVTAVTPNDVYMMEGDFDANGAFVRKEQTDHVVFQNIPGSPTQPGNLFYWNGRVGNAVPANIKVFGGTSGYDSGGIGMSGYGVTGGHQVSANMPGEMTSDQRVGKIGFVCSESKVNVIVDNVLVKTAGKNVTVDGEVIQVPAEGKVNVSNLQSSDKKLIYATVDGVNKYVGESFFATRLTEITTTQVALSTNKVVADGKTGLKYVTLINKADLDKITSDENVAKVEYGTVIAPTANAKDGVTIITATSNIAGTVVLDGENYVFEGVLPVGKNARDTSYSGVGYIKVTMKDGKETVVYADYFARLHAYALSDLVESFDDEEPNDGNVNNDDTTTNDDTSAETSPVAGDGKDTDILPVIAVSIAVIAVAAVIVVIAIKKKKAE